MNKDKISLLIITGFLSAAILLFPKAGILAQTAGNSSDAIGVRIIPNPNHYSVYRWYDSQGFSGSPQALVVDGYEALRDGRTVYVNAANVDMAAKKIYTNIYLISFNQDPNAKTIDILGQLVSHWTFNDNLPPEISTCSISSVKCESDANCATTETCQASSGTCALKEAKNCSVDDDCPANFFCGSLKAKVIRDIKRVGKLEEVREALAKYKASNNSYPKLTSGTYLPGMSVSLWPSWNNVLTPALSMGQGLIDPINRLGACPGYDAQTCWNNSTKKFVYDPAGSVLQLPKDSYALVYGTNSSGSEYSLCAVMESRDASLGYSFSPATVKSDNCVTATGVLVGGNLKNSAPIITDLALNGVAGREYNGFVIAADSDNDPLTWTLQASAGAGWSAAPVLKDTGNRYQKKLYAAQAGSAGNYPVTITVSDDKGGSVSTTTSIVITSGSALIQADNYIYRLDPTVPFIYNYYVSNSAGTPALSIASGTVNALYLQGITATSTSDSLGRTKTTFQGIIATSTKFQNDSETIYTLKAGSATSNFSIKIKVDAPLIDFNCSSQSRVNYPYKCRLGSIKQGNHDISYRFGTGSAQPAGLAIALGSDDKFNYYLSGTTTQALVGQEIIVEAVNEYGTTSTKKLLFNVNTYCGDGIRQGFSSNAANAIPNTEGRGGIFNDGFESCDGENDVAATASASNIYNQYACNTTGIAQTPYPIPSNSYCVFRSPIDGGGYCGDSFCQVDKELNCTDPCCKFDCDPTYLGPEQTLGANTNVQTTGCLSDTDCQTGYKCNSFGACEKKCWSVLETTAAITYRQGDITRDSSITGCTVNAVDNPYCGADPGCPYYCNNRKTQLANTSAGSDSCYYYGGWFNTKHWSSRFVYKCERLDYTNRCYQDECKTDGSLIINGTMSADGVCTVVTSNTGGNTGGNSYFEAPCDCMGAEAWCNPAQCGSYNCVGAYGYCSCAGYDQYMCPGIAGCDWITVQNGTCQ